MGERITAVDHIDDLLYSYYQKTNSDYLCNNPEYRFKLISYILKELCPFNLSIDEDEHLDFKVETSLSEKICNSIHKIIDRENVRYFAASYWSPIDFSRHTISRSIRRVSIEEKKYSKSSALLFYLLSISAPPIFHSAIQYISQEADKKDGLHSYYMENEPIEDEHVWWHLPFSIHERLLNESDFLSAIDLLTKKEYKEIEEDLTIIMENIDKEAVSNIISKYEYVLSPIKEKAKTFVIPSDLKAKINEWKIFFDTFLYFESTSIDRKLTEKQIFYMACTHALYNKACPTNMFYMFPVRIYNTCCTFTLGTEEVLTLDQMSLIYHVIKSIYYHAIVMDYQSKNELERNNIALGAIHKIRTPLSNLYDYFEFEIEDLLDSTFPKEASKIKKALSPANKRLENFTNNIMRGVRSLENFLGIEKAGKINIIETLEEVKNTLGYLFSKGNDKLIIENTISESEVCIYGTQSNIQFVFEELVYNSIESNTDNKDDGLIVKIIISKSEHEVIIDLHDNGIGVLHNQKEKIFDRGASSRGSTGMGLHLCKYFIEKHGHKIIECGEYSKGAHFRLCFKEEGGVK